MAESTTPRHTWRFFRAGGFDQVRIDSGADIANIGQLDQKLWVALACPTRGLEFDSKTLDLIDTDKDGRIRPPELIAAAKWATGLLKNPDELIKGSGSLPLAAINDALPEGKAILASARQILVNLGKSDAGSISVEDTTDTAKIFAATKFNGDGVIPADSSDDPVVQKVIADVIACTGGTPDRSGKAGITTGQLDAFWADANAFSDWHKKAESDAGVLAFGADTATAATAFSAVKAKVDDYFARCRLAAYDGRAIGALNRQEAEYLAIAAKDLTITASEVAGFPLAKVEAGRALPLIEGLNPAWAGAIAALRDAAVKPLMGDKSALTEAEWSAISVKLAPYQAWVAAKAGASVEKLGLGRVREILAGNAKAAITELLAKDKALEPEANAIAAVDKLARYNRDLHKLIVNFVNFKEFYARKKAVFQVGTLYLDQRSCDLCVRVEDAGRHGMMAHMSNNYLAYCDVVRKSTGEKLSIAAAFTAGDSDNLMVGRNGVFYDRAGNDWDATIVKIVDNPISIRQAFWSPYKRAIRFVQDQIAKRAAAADAAANSRLEAAALATATSAQTGQAPPAKPKIDIGVVAALGVAVGGVTAALGALLQAFFGLGIWMPLGFLALILLISGPSMLIAWLKLRQRNLGPILDANGWAVNAKAKINLPFGRSLTQMAKLPPGSSRDLSDPYAESKAGRIWTTIVVLLVLTLWGMWYFGCIEYYWPNALPKSGYVERKLEEKKKADEEAAKKAAEEAAKKADAAAKAAKESSDAAAAASQAASQAAPK